MKTFLLVIFFFIPISLFALEVGGGRQRVVLGDNITVKKGENYDTLVVVGGNATISGNIKELVIIGSNVELTQDAKIYEDLVIVGSQIIRHEAAKVYGEETNFTAGRVSKYFKNWDQTAEEHFISLPWSIGGLVASLIFLFAFGFLYLKMCPQLHWEAMQVLTSSKIEAFGWGALSFVLITPATLILALSVIGIPFLPLFFVLMLLGLIIGYVTTCQYVGDNLPLKTKPKGPAAMLLGMLVLWFFGLIPIVGWSLRWLATMWGFGAVNLVVYRRIKSTTKHIVE